MRIFLASLVISIFSAQNVAADVHSIIGSAVGAAIINNQLQGSSRRGASRLPQVKVRPADLTREQARQIQSDLSLLGYVVGPVDGVIGAKTKSRIAQFQSDIGKPATGQLSVQERFVLTEAAIRVRTGTGMTPSDAIRSVLADYPSAGKGAQAVVSLPVVSTAVPSRLFVTKEEHPPQGFRGYGVVAFKSRATDFDRDRHFQICEAYVASLLKVGNAGVPEKDQFVTVWPMLTSEKVKFSNESDESKSSCASAIGDYDLGMASETIRSARVAGFDDQGVGPFLLGWLPATKFGEDDALILSLDMSNVRTYDQALALMQDWRNDIESDPSLLSGSLSIEGMRRKIRRWSDQHGQGVFSVFFGG